MQDRPTYDELLHAVERFLEDLVESSDGAQGAYWQFPNRGGGLLLASVQVPNKLALRVDQDSG